MYFCMSRVQSAFRSHTVHGVPLPRSTVRSHEGAYTMHGGDLTVHTWAARSDEPHKCDVAACTLHRWYVRLRFRGIATKAVLHSESRRSLRTRIPGELVEKIMLLVRAG